MSRRDEETSGGLSSEISAGVVYSLEDFKTRTGLGDAGLRNARRAGLRVRYAHNRAFIFGEDWSQYLTEHSTTTPPGPAEGQGPRSRSMGEEYSYE